MKISDKWLRTYLETDLSAEKLGVILTDLGLEVEGIDPYESVKGSLNGVVVGKVLTCEQHPNADKLKVTTVDINTGTPLHIVCGAPNVAAGQTVAVATIGTMIYLQNGDSFKIAKSKLRGEVSEGMLCAEDELGLGQSHAGIMVLPEDYVIGKPLSDYIPVEKDEVYEIGLTANRTDAMSHYGVARDLQAYLSLNKIKSAFKKLETSAPATEGTHDFKLDVEDADLIPRYLGAVIEGVQVEESPEWLKNRLKAIGLGPINNIVDITNYILHSYGQPLHAFDAAKINGHEVKVGFVPEGTKFKTLDGVERSLNGTEIMIKDGKNTPLCIAGVFGGEESGVSEGTTTIFLESAYFNPVAVRKAAKAHALNTDASFRFERGVDPNITKDALIKAVELIQEIAGGKLQGEILEFFPKKIEHFNIILRYSKIDQILGIKIHRETIKEILKSLDILVLNEIKDGLEIAVPPYRADVTREIDVIEEILRVYGYNKVNSQEKIEFTPVRLTLDDQDSLENFWARTLQSNGFNEVMNNSLTSLKEERTDAVTLLNPLSNELSTMRQSLLEGLLQNADYNIKRKTQDIKFFEFGKVYFKKAKFEERKQLAMLVSGNNNAENWLLSKSPTDFFILKGYVQILLDKLGLDTTERALEDSRFSDAIEILSDGRTLARIGVVSKALLKDADLSQAAYYAEFELETCQELRSTANFKFVDIPKFNKIRRDLALLVDKTVSYNDLLQASKDISANLKKIQLFDVYEGKNLPEGKKSYALSFELLNTEKTLEEAEISNIMNKLIKKFQKEFEAELRS
ncbi:phenylalanine--tRNA ligase subunit beta [Elizabethkingia meningoseptica]|uniref:phenylalanine--tRNA ligase subunit beta n=1 Tax=Elizabethkingia meningoseptica TaxID=238 RepID=UPI0023B132DB|nr:phenylalanine--tRNA ligase subunit beta [Elizabethkingia meningoseptica]MDE5436935.1 phenylalanine--tRNA ligase subunit beta [Elizabethkingia meningoseptica]MDE5509038.1 phenylalanine--tRNA ligase subunit beta [Elizabethkingia meningoseptica]MDE5514555.1 phenylalanine--tRNA ligase subunit beta [Elizabethkingia meningoseptica]MDE5528766.1 phenylalanine--tRNA ligase subunit beta [Elizabethkingia meningoseptica]MDE5532322.1 phenylalanine--tRNA ligase subunit beta [Elizabethkingia meningoseptic